MIAKVVLGKEMHIYRGYPDLHHLQKYCYDAFKGLQKRKETLQFFYVDEDGDKICINTQQDLSVLENMSSISSINKLFIQEIEGDFQDLNPESDEPESRPVKFIEKFHIFPREKYGRVAPPSRFKQEAMIKSEAKKYYNKLVEQTVKKICDEKEDEMIKGQVNSYLDDLINECSESIARQEELQLNQSQFLQITSYGIKNERSLETNHGMQGDVINRLVEQKINRMVPDLIKRVSKGVETRLMIYGCLRCGNAKPQRSGSKQGKKYEEW